MTNSRIHENRLWNFRQIVKAAKGNNAAANILGVRGPYIGQIAGKNPTRTIGDRMAARIEKAFGLKPGDLDLDPPTEAETKDPFIAEIVATLSHVDDADKEFVLGMTQWIARRSTAERAARVKPGKVDLSAEADRINYDVGAIASVSKKEDSHPALAIKQNRESNAKKK